VPLLLLLLPQGLDSSVYRVLLLLIWRRGRHWVLLLLCHAIGVLRCHQPAAACIGPAASGWKRQHRPLMFDQCLTSRCGQLRSRTVSQRSNNNGMPLCAEVDSSYTD
jgi:hypothetical protein